MAKKPVAMTFVSMLIPTEMFDDMFAPDQAPDGVFHASEPVDCARFEQVEHCKGIGQRGALGVRGAYLSRHEAARAAQETADREREEAEAAEAEAVKQREEATKAEAEAAAAAGPVDPPPPPKKAAKTAGGN